MKALKPINLQQWIADHRELLKPPVGNKIVCESDDYIIMIVGGPNSRTDFHISPSEEIFYQIEGEICLRVAQNGGFEDINIKPGELFLLPAGLPHAPVRGPNTVGLVIEKKRTAAHEDIFCWFCQKCNHRIYQESVFINDIVGQLPIIFEHFYQSEVNRTCERCGTLFEKPTS